MGIQIGKYLSFVLTAALLFGCTNYEIKDIEKSFKVNIKEFIELSDKYEQWNDFNGDGYKIITYDVKADFWDTLFYEMKNIKFDKFDIEDSNDIFSNTIMTKYLMKKSKGFYKVLNYENESKTIVLDSMNRKIFYLHEIN